MARECIGCLHDIDPPDGIHRYFMAGDTFHMKRCARGPIERELRAHDLTMPRRPLSTAAHEVFWTARLDMRRRRGALGTDRDAEVMSEAIECAAELGL